jgi:hypothetical protein
MKKTAIGVLLTLVIGVPNIMAGMPISRKAWEKLSVEALYIGTFADPAGFRACFFIEQDTGALLGPFDLDAMPDSPDYQRAPGIGKAPREKTGTSGVLNFYGIVTKNTVGSDDESLIGTPREGVFISFQAQNASSKNNMLPEQIARTTMNPLVLGLLTGSPEAGRPALEKILSMPGLKENDWESETFWNSVLWATMIARSGTAAKKILAEQQISFSNKDEDYNALVPLYFDGLKGLAGLPDPEKSRIPLSGPYALRKTAARWINKDTRGLEGYMLDDLLDYEINEIDFSNENRATRNMESFVEPEPGPFMREIQWADILKSVDSNFYDFVKQTLGRCRTMVDCYVLSNTGTVLRVICSKYDVIQELLSDGNISDIGFGSRINVLAESTERPQGYKLVKYRKKGEAGNDMLNWLESRVKDDANLALGYLALAADKHMSGYSWEKWDETFKKTSIKNISFPEILSVLPKPDFAERVEQFFKPHVEAAYHLSPDNVMREGLALISVYLHGKDMDSARRMLGFLPEVMFATGNIYSTEKKTLGMMAEAELEAVSCIIDSMSGKPKRAWPDKFNGYGGSVKDDFTYVLKHFPLEMRDFMIAQLNECGMR